MQRAKEMSLNDSQTFPAQETGVTYANPYFGPATQSHYDSEKWALTVAEAQTQEILLNPEAPDRQRSPGTPAFLKPSSTNDSLPPLIKILHAIPLAREALLNRSCLLNDYGQNSEWWDGTSIRGLRVINVDEGVDDVQHNDIIHETQRLIAFLDNTERAYGSADALIGLPAFRRAPESTASSFLDSWKNATESSVDAESHAAIFSSRGTRRTKRSDQADQFEPFCCLKVRVDSAIADKGFSLYEAIDDMVHTTSVEFDTFLDHVGEILTFEVTNHLETSRDLGISIPPIWYADRYLESSLEVAAQMQAEKDKIHVMGQEANDAQALMTSFQKPGSQTAMDVGPLITRITDYFTQTIGYKEATKTRDAQSPESPSQSIVPIVEQLSLLTKRVTEKVNCKHVHAYLLAYAKTLSLR